MRRSLQLLAVAAAIASGGWLLAQGAVPEITFDSASDFLKWPDNIVMGEAAGVATNSRGDVFVFTRTGDPTVTIGTSRAFAHNGSRLFQFDRSGKFVRESAQGADGPRRSAGQRLDCRSDVDPGHQVRPERPHSTDPQPEARESSGAGARGSAAGRAGAWWSRRPWRSAGRRRPRRSGAPRRGR